MEKRFNDSYKEDVINIIDLIAEFIRKAYLIVICAIIGAVLLGGYELIAGMNTEKESINVEYIKENLSEESNEKLDEYLMILEKIDSIEEYMENSAYMEIDPYDVHVINLQFRVNVESEEIINIKRLYETYIKSSNVISDVVGESTNTKFLLGIIECAYESTATELADKVISVNIYGKDQTTVELYAQNFKNAIEDYTGKLINSGISHELVLLDEKYKQSVNTNFYDYKSKVQSYLQSLETQKQEKYSTLSTEENIVLESMLGNSVEESERSGINAIAVLKSVIIGGIAGAMVSILLIFAVYYLTYTVKTSTEIASKYGLAYIGGVSLSKKRLGEKFASQIVYKKKPGAECIERKIFFEKLVLMCKKQEVKELSIIGTEEVWEKDFICCLKDSLNERGVSTKIVGNICNSPDNIAKMCEAENVVILETLGKSSWDEINNEIQLCEMQKIKIVGYGVFM